MAGALLGLLTALVGAYLAGVMVGMAVIGYRQMIDGVEAGCRARTPGD